MNRKLPQGQFDKHFRGTKEARMAMLVRSLSPDMRRALLTGRAEQMGTILAMSVRGVARYRAVVYWPVPNCRRINKYYLLEVTPVGRDVAQRLACSTLSQS